jgi:hypothetical protein
MIDDGATLPIVTGGGSGRLLTVAQLGIPALLGRAASAAYLLRRG